MNWLTLICGGLNCKHALAFCCNESFCAVSAELIKPLSHARHLSLLPPCHYSRAKQGDHEHFFYPLRTLPPWQVQSNASRATWIISFPFSYCQPWQQLSANHLNCASQGNAHSPPVIILSISAFCHCHSDFRPADSHVVSFMFATYTFVYCVQIHCL